MDQTEIVLEVRVTNIGDFAGKAVVQGYAALPDGKLEKESHRLVAFRDIGLFKMYQKAAK